MSGTTAWLVVGIVGAGTMAMKAVGPVVLGGRTLPDRAMSVISLLAPAVLAGLIVTQTIGGNHHYVFDARLAGLAAAAVALRFRAPLLVVVVLAAAVTAVVRALF
jgi:branched-subunit amino acid transport protein